MQRVSYSCAPGIGSDWLSTRGSTPWGAPRLCYAEREGRTYYVAPHRVRRRCLSRNETRDGHGPCAPLACVMGAPASARTRKAVRKARRTGGSSSPDALFSPCANEDRRLHWIKPVACRTYSSCAWNVSPKKPVSARFATKPARFSRPAQTQLAQMFATRQGAHGLHALFLQMRAGKHIRAGFTRQGQAPQPDSEHTACAQQEKLATALPIRLGTSR